MTLAFLGCLNVLKLNIYGVCLILGLPKTESVIFPFSNIFIMDFLPFHPILLDMEMYSCCHNRLTVKETVSFC